MARTVDTSSTLENWRQNYNNLATDVGDPATLTTADKTNVVNAINYIMDQYFFFQDFDFDGSDGDSSNTVFPGSAMGGLDNAGNTFQYKPQKVLVYKNGLLLRSGTDYTAINGTTITLASSANNSDVIRVSSYTGSYTASPSGAESQFYWQTAGSNVYNNNSAGIVLQTGRAIGSIVTAPTVANSIQLDGDTYSNGHIYLNAQKKVRWQDDDSSNYVAIQAPDDVSTNRTLTLPSAEDGYMIAVAAVGSNGQVLSSDGDGSYSWTNVSNTNTTYTTSWVDSSNDAILRLTPSTGSADDLTIVAGSGITVTPSGDNLTIAATAAVPTQIDPDSANTNSSTWYPLFHPNGTSAVGTPATDTGLTYVPSTGMLTAAGFTGPLTGNVTGNLTGTVATASQGSITAMANLVTVGTIGTGTWQGTAIASGYIANDAITGAKIADNAIDSEHYTDGSIDTAHIAADQITSALIADDQVTSDHIADGAIDLPPKLAAGVVQLAKLDPSMIQLSSESFADNDTSLMTSAAIQDKILSYGYTTETGDITGVTAGTGLSGGGTSGTVTLDFDFSELTDMTGDIAGTTEFIIQNGSTESRKAASEIKLSYFNNNSGWTTNTGTVDTANSPVDNDFAKFTDANTIEGRSYSEVRSDLGIADNEILDWTTDQGSNNIHANNYTDTTYSVGDNGLTENNFTNALKSKLDNIASNATANTGTVDTTGSPVDNDFAKFTDSNTLEGRSYAEVRSDLGITDNEILDWTADQGSNNIHANNYTDTGDTTYSAGSGIGLSGTAFSVAVNGSVSSPASNLVQDSNGISITATPTFSTVAATGDITAFSGSDIALKENIINIPNPLEKLSKIGGYMFDWKDHGYEDVHGKGHDTGILAQEIEEILPEIVNTRESGMKAVNYMKLIPLLVESIKELKTELDELKSSNS